MNSRIHAHPGRIALTLLLLAANGCNDAGTPATPATLDPNATLAARPGELRDAEIDRTDTYFAFHLTTTESVDDGGVSIQSVASEETRYYETGYEPDGDLLLDVYRGPSTDPSVPDPPAL